MARRIDIWLNGVALRDVDPRILISELRDTVPRMETKFGDNPGRDGQRLMTYRRVNKVITIDVQLRELFRLDERQRILDEIGRWMTEGWLQSSTQPGKRIYVIPTAFPAMAEARKYTATYQLGFTAAASPFWEEERPRILTLDSGTSGAGTIVNPGSVEAYPEIIVTANSSTLTSINITVGATSFQLSGLSVAQGAHVSIDHDARGLLRIMTGGTSLMGKRSAASSDELICEPGQSAVGFTADKSVDVSVSVRGRYK